MNFLNFDLKKLLSYLLILSLPLISINMQQNRLQQKWYDRPFSYISSATQSVFFAFTDSVRSNTALYLNLINIKKENLELKSLNRELQSRLETFEEAQNEISRLNQLLDFRSKSKMQLVAARIMSKDLVSDHKTLAINKGTEHGLVSGQAVITVGGAVGYVFKPQPTTSQILLITDRYSAIDGLVARSRARGIVEGTVSGSAFQYVEKSEDIRPGDLVVTSGLDNIFPKGFPIATVEKVEDLANAVSLKVELKPVVDPDKIEEVFVIINAAFEDLTPPDQVDPSLTGTASAPASALVATNAPIKTSPTTTTTTTTMTTTTQPTTTARPDGG